MYEWKVDPKECSFLVELQLVTSLLEIKLYFSV